MKIEFNKNEISKNIGIEFVNSEDYLNYLQHVINDLESHNMNLQEVIEFFK